MPDISKRKSESLQAGLSFFSSLFSPLFSCIVDKKFFYCVLASFPSTNCVYRIHLSLP